MYRQACDRTALCLKQRGVYTRTLPPSITSALRYTMHKQTLVEMYSTQSWLMCCGFSTEAGAFLVKRKTKVVNRKRRTDTATADVGAGKRP